MKIFIDESGTFSGFHAGSIGAVGALAIPNRKLALIESKYEKIRRRLPRYNGEVKGRLLNEQQIADVVALLAKNEVVFEITAIDLGLHTVEGVAGYKAALLAGMYERLPRFNDSARPTVARQLAELEATPINLFLQAITLFQTIHLIIRHVPLYFAQRRPEELGEFGWVIDGKDRAKVTSWESWWASYAAGALSTKSRYHPGVRLEGADYSHFDRLCHPLQNETEEGTDLSLLLKDMRFSSQIEFGLELVDILTNAIRRALVGNLAAPGWKNIVRTMIHRREHYITFVRLDGVSMTPKAPTYTAVVRHFWKGGKSMLTRHNLQIADEEELLTK
jgi:hypothetical protein